MKTQKLSETREVPPGKGSRVLRNDLITSQMVMLTRLHPAKLQGKRIAFLTIKILKNIITFQFISLKKVKLTETIYIFQVTV